VGRRFLCAVATATDRGSVCVGSEESRLRARVGGRGLGRLRRPRRPRRPVRGLRGLERGKRHRGEGSENMHGECKNRLRFASGEMLGLRGMRKLVFPMLMGVNFSHGSRGTRQGCGNTQRGDSSALARRGGCLSLSTNSGETGRWTSHTVGSRYGIPRIGFSATYGMRRIRLRIPSENSTRHRSDYPMVAALEPPTLMMRWGGGRGAHQPPGSRGVPPPFHHVRRTACYSQAWWTPGPPRPM
jgi:hypothetical protein